MGISKTVLKHAAPLPQVESFERYLFVGPHPDDIEIGAGATAAKLAAAGKTITFVICTDGRFGDGASGGVTGDELAALRKKEARRSARVLGVSDLRFLDLCDGAGYTQEELEAGLAAVMAQVRPQVVIAPDPDVISECHADHRMAGEAAKKLAFFCGHPGIMRRLYDAEGCEPVEALAFMMTARPNRYVKTAPFMKKQFQSVFCCHTSQYPADSPDAASLKTYIKLRAADYGLRTLSLGAEGFRVLGHLHMHCLPEFGL
ncbi:MAG: PIG-L family deacetylase [Lachnospiraceae bacterium]|nr:PIG-L family deacetylase [Lachnospiraceae bacterium]